jgi:pimeloyl-ACP methyl ester carboxylesterase
MFTSLATEAQEVTISRDPSPHRVRTVTVDSSVQIEVLDWGGSGPPLVLLAGAGNTAHVFDEFAPRLASVGRVYGITRRGYGASTAPAAGYSVERLGTDVLQVLDALALERPVLIGHSIAGQELSFLATHHPNRIVGVVYLDGAYRYALHRPGAHDNLRELRRKLDLLEAALNGPPQTPSQLSTAIRSALGGTLDEFQQDLRELMTAPEARPVSPPAPTPSDLKDVAAYRAWSARVFGYALPEGELMATRAIDANGSVGSGKSSAEIGRMIQSGGRRFTSIPIPTLAIFASPHDQGPWTRNDPAARETFEAFARFDEAMTERQAAWVERHVAGARVVRLRNAHHYVFITHAAEVQREISAFVKVLSVREGHCQKAHAPASIAFKRSFLSFSLGLLAVPSSHRSICATVTVCMTGVSHTTTSRVAARPGVPAVKSVLVAAVDVAQRGDRARDRRVLVQRQVSA